MIPSPFDGNTCTYVQHTANKSANFTKSNKGELNGDISAYNENVLVKILDQVFGPNSNSYMYTYLNPN